MRYYVHEEIFIYVIQDRTRIDGRDTHREYTVNIDTQRTDRERAKRVSEIDCYKRARETEEERASKTNVGPNSLSLDSITFNRLAGPMLPGAE